MNNYRELKVWNESVELAVEVYTKVKAFPKDELFGLTSQMKRAAVSITSNIAEGAARNSQKDFKRFLSMASGSAAELSSQIEIAQKLKFVSDLEFNTTQTKLEMIHKMIYKLQAAIQKSINDKNSNKK